MIEKPSNPPAFPCEYTMVNGNVVEPETDDGFKSHGMSLRDYFAAKAMAAMLSNSSLVDNFSSHALVSKESFIVADEMLLERAK